MVFPAFRYPPLIRIAYCSEEHCIDAKCEIPRSALDAPLVNSAFTCNSSVNEGRFVTRWSTPPSAPVPKSTDPDDFRISTLSRSCMLIRERAPAISLAVSILVLSMRDTMFDRLIPRMETAVSHVPSRTRATPGTLSSASEIVLGEN